MGGELHGGRLRGPVYRWVNRCGGVKSSTSSSSILIQPLFDRKATAAARVKGRPRLLMPQICTLEGPAVPTI